MSVTISELDCPRSLLGSGAWAISLYHYDGPAAGGTPAVGSTATSPASPVTWSYLQCSTDGGARALTGASVSSQTMTVSMCLSYCASSGFYLAGLENGNECYCGNSIQNGQSKSADTECAAICAGDLSSKSICG